MEIKLLQSVFNVQFNLHNKALIKKLHKNQPKKKVL